MVVWNTEDEQMYVPVCGGLFSNDRQVRGERKHGLHLVLILSILMYFQTRVTRIMNPRWE